MGSIQFNNALFLAKTRLHELGYNNIDIPQSKPRSKGEILGCTSPSLSLKEYKNNPVAVFVCDGRFHMESAMISNPNLDFYQYNPYTKKLSLEKYDIKLMKEIRHGMINRAKNAKSVGIIFGMLGRQGNPDILNVITFI
jgi:2-(3-amino-3-carboxypropyl)histidine synthase